MAFRGTVVRGTPYTFKGGNNREGMTHGGGKPEGYAGRAGVVRDQYEGSGHGPGQVRAEMSGEKTLGTPYQSLDGNGPEYRRVRSDNKFGEVVSENGINHNIPEQNGNGVVLDGISMERSYLTRGEQTMDSPVPTGAQRPIPDEARDINNLHSGEGEYWGKGDGPKDHILANDGVMSRGMLGTSKHNGSETELVEDDVLKNLGRGGAVG